MSWAYMQIEMVPDDALLMPTYGTEPGMTRGQAHAEIQSILDRIPILAPIADLWRTGADDDTVHGGPFTWTIYEYDDDPQVAALAWLGDYAQTMCDAGVDVSIATLTPTSR